ncbi:MAG: hypothetical protein IKR25_04585 [Muribaculaceae bacterium]|nr:hypothetical protein [Muribaculaceae bacterium]
MKTIKSYIMLLVFALCMSLSAGSQVLRNANYDAIGRISPNGLVRDAAAHTLGSFEPDGTVKDKSGKELGRIQRLEIFDNEGTRVGYINTDGTVRTGESNLLGTISINDGKVTDAEHNVLGYARGIRVDWIACYFFFDFFKTN